MPRIAVSTCAVLLTIAPFGLSVANATDTTVPQSPDSTYVYDLEREPADCIGFLPKPGCGKKPEQAGDRGGPLQYLTMGIMAIGVGIVGTVLARNVIKRDRAIAERIQDTEK